MRSVLAAITALCLCLCLTLPAWAFDMPKGFEEIGRYSVELDGERLEIISVTSTHEAFSDLHFTHYEDTAGRTIRRYTIQATSGFNELGDNERPILLVEFDYSIGLNALIPSRIILVDQSWDAPLATHPEQSEKRLEVSNLIFAKDGIISFDFRAELVRMDWVSSTPYAGAQGANIQGSFSGKFPEFALKYPFMSGGN